MTTTSALKDGLKVGTRAVDEDVAVGIFPLPSEPSIEETSEVVGRFLRDQTRFRGSTTNVKRR